MSIRSIKVKLKYSQGYVFGTIKVDDVLYNDCASNVDGLRKGLEKLLKTFHGLTPCQYILLPEE